MEIETEKENLGILRVPGGAGERDRVRGRNAKSRGVSVVRGKTRGVVTDRDREALRLVCEQGAVSVDQLWRGVWDVDCESQSPRYTYERVKFLEESRFLEGVRSTHNLKTYFRATSKTVACVAAGGVGASLIPSSKTPTNEIPHVDVLTEIRLAATKAGKVSSWQTDRMLLLDPNFPRERVLVPDAIWVTKSGRRIAVEFERTRKKRTRVKDKAESFSREMARPDGLVDHVLWFAAPAVERELREVIRPYPNQEVRLVDQFLKGLRGSIKNEVTKGE